MTTADGGPAASGNRASEVLQARLEPARMSRVARFGRNALALALSTVTGGAGAEDALPGVDLVVVRRGSGAEVLRVRAGTLEEADILLDRTRRDLAALTVEQFVREWRLVD